MHPVVNHLIQLQELTLIRDEQKIARGGRKHLEELDASIEQMAGELPREIGVMFEKLHKKNRIIITPISDGVCAACGMKLPISQVQAVRIAKFIYNCPNCARMLYYLEAFPRHIGIKVARRSDPIKPGISRFSSNTLMIPKLESTERDGVIRELAYKMEFEGFVDKGEQLVEAALRREAILSTAVDHGIAFPHVRGVEGGGLTLALGISRKGIKFAESARVITRIVFFIVIPTAASAFYLKLLSGLTETFMNAEARRAIMAEKEPKKLWKAFLKVTRGTIK